jgi:hypothetical protein
MDDETRLVPAQDESALTEKETAAVVPVTVDELAVKVLAALDMIAAVISDLRKPHPATAKKVRGARTVPHEAVSSHRRHGGKRRLCSRTSCRWTSIELMRFWAPRMSTGSAAHVATVRRHLGRRNAATGKRKKKPE